MNWKAYTAAMAAFIISTVYFDMLFLLRGALILLGVGLAVNGIYKLVTNEYR